jgi:hypothetical protein
MNTISQPMVAARSYTRPLRIAVENSTWNNIGDAFYQSAILQMMTECFPDDEILPFDGPINRAFPSRGLERNVLDVRKWVDADHYVLSGPILGMSLITQYLPFLRQLREQGKTYSIISAHGRGTPETEAAIAAFFEEYPPLVLHTREAKTYEKYARYARSAYNGCCFAFFVCKLPDGQHLAPDRPYVCASYHSMPEARIRLGRTGEGAVDIDSVSVEMRSALLPWRIARHLEFLRSAPEAVGGFDIVRPVHSFYPLPHLTFNRPNSFISYNPLNFLSVYRHCEMVFTDRVHAAVAALSFGRPAHVVRVDDRFELFRRIGVQRNEAGVLTLERSEIDQAYGAVRDWLVNDARQAMAA